MKRVIKPFTVEVRRGRKGPATWPTISKPPPVYPKLGRYSPRSAVVAHHAEQPASPAWTGARILPVIERPHPDSDEQRDGAALNQAESRAEPVQERVESREDTAPKPHQGRDEPAQAAEPAAEQQQDGPAEASAAMGAKVIMQIRKAVPALGSKAIERPERSVFRRGERWKSRLPTVVARKHVKRQQRGKPAANTAE